MMVTKDEYRLPVMVADSPTELARMAGTTPQNINSSIYHGYEDSMWERVWIEDD